MSTDVRTDAIDEALESLRAQVRGAKRERRRRRSWTPGRVARLAATGVLAVVAPFLMLVKVAVAIHLQAGVHPWISLGVSALLTAILLTALAITISYRVRRRVAVAPFAFKSAATLVGAYCLYSVLFISGGNVKSPEIADTYRSLHPLLRLGVSTLVLVDEELVVTDAARDRSDYEGMGLPVNERSLHFRQASGYVHAVDLRTIGRTRVRNAVSEFYFRMMGFQTLRHVGTADHLHVSLPVQNDRALLGPGQRATLPAE